MSTQSMFSNQPLNRRDLVDNYFSDFAMDLLKKRRFEVGCPDKAEAKELFLIDRILKSGSCKTDENLKQQITKLAVKSIRELK